MTAEALSFSYSLVSARDLAANGQLTRKITASTDWGADKSLALPTSRCILFDGENISFDASLVIYSASREECARLRENVP